MKTLTRTKEQSMNAFSSWRPFACLFVAAAVFSLAAPAWAAERPYASSGTAQFVSATDFVGTGTATHLGRYREAGSAEFSPTDDPIVLAVVAHSTYTAANGDQLRAVITAQVNTLTGAIVGVVSFTGGTGRFADATGTADFSGQMLPGGALRAATDGTIDFGGD